MVGLDLTLDIHKTIIPELDRSAGPHPVLDEYIATGRLGFKSGEGFQKWTKQDIEELRKTLSDHLVAANQHRELES